MSFKLTSTDCWWWMVHCFPRQDTPQLPFLRAMKFIKSGEIILKCCCFGFRSLLTTVQSCLIWQAKTGVMDKKSSFQWLTLGTWIWSWIFSCGKKEKNTQWSVLFSPHKWRWEDTVDKEKTFNIILFNNLNYSCTRKRTEQDIVKPKKGLRLEVLTIFSSVTFFAVWNWVVH